jgi:exopolyphosphatase/guanosine-5'-triphosphate,3'-diphosphate pyrophosphatase
VAERTGLTVEVLSGDEEARLSFLGAVTTLPPRERAAVFDVGGGSTELACGRGDRVEALASVDCGTLEPTVRFLRSDPVAPREVDAARAWIADRLAPLRMRAAGRSLIGVGGTAATIGAVALGRWRGAAAALHGRSIDRREIDRQIELFRRLPLPARRGLPGLPLDRAEVILAGALVVDALLALAGVAHFEIAVHDLRQGLLADRYGSGRGGCRLRRAAQDPP